MAKKKRVRRRYSEKQKTQVLVAARREGLTAGQVQKRFGVAPVTYYSWRQKAGAGKRRWRRAGFRVGRGGDLASQLLAEVRAKIRELLPGIVRSEIELYLGSAFHRRGK